MFNVSGGTAPPVFLDPETGLVVSPETATRDPMPGFARR